MHICPKKAFSCCIIGQGSVAIQCIQILREHRCAIHSLISTDNALKKCELNQKTTLFDNIKAFLQCQHKVAIDYLFSIANEVIIPDSILRLPRKMAINYHNGPLPSYAGVNAVSWAILNKENQHGITWHKMVRQVDEGDILKQVHFKIDAQETALTLSAKCHEEAIKSFRELIRDLLANRVFCTQQHLKDKTYFSLKDRPNGNGLVSWNRSAEDIDRLFRALNYGHYNNPFALPKFYMGDSIFIIDHCQLTHHRSCTAPGTLTGIHDDYIQVSTRTKDIRITKLSTLDVKNYSIAQLKQEYELKTGFKLPVLSTATLSLIEKKSGTIAKHEKYWVNQLYQEKESCVSHLKKMVSCRRVVTKTHRIKITLQKFCQTLRKNFVSVSSDQIIVTLFTLYLFRINNFHSFHIQFRKEKKNQPSILALLYEASIPINIKLDTHQNFIELLLALEQHMKAYQSHEGFSKDIYLRYNILPNKIEQIIVIDLVRSLHNYRLSDKANLAFAIIEGKGEVLITSQLSEKIGDFAHQVAKHIQKLAESILANIELPIYRLTLLEAKAYQTMVFYWNKKQAPFPHRKTVNQLLQEVVRRFPKKIAVQFYNEQVTYQILHQKINDFSVHLINKGIQAGDYVAIYMNRNIEMIVSLFSVLKVGATYVPINSDDPENRVQHILNDCRPRAVIVEEDPSHRMRKIFNNSKVEVVLLNTVRPMVVDPDTESEKPAHSSTNRAAYAIYTSGSTGMPKGVVVSNSSLVNLAFSEIKALDINSNTRTLQFAPLSFDAAVWEIYATLFSGGTLFLAKREAILPIKPLLKTLNTYRINFVTLPPTVLGRLNPEDLPQPITVVNAGAPCTLPILEAWSRKHNFVNAYGPTETTVCATLTHLGPKDSPACIGKPIHNVQAYILDEFLNPLPMGSIGTLYIGGKGLSTGYLNKPALTKKYFIANPFADGKQSLIYKTGDLAYWLPDGNLYYVGRIDDQVKIRGFRIELSAIELQLQKQNTVKQAFVTVRKNKQGDQYLVAYLVPNLKPALLNCFEVRKALLQRLPHYMIPQLFVVMDAIPTKINGKIDTKALPNPPDQQTLIGTTHVPAKSEVEIKLKKLWEAVLSVKNIGVNDHFFELGGNSLIIANLLTQVNQTFNQSITLPNFIKNPTIGHLAHLLQGKQTKTPDKSIKIISKDTILPNTIIKTIR